MSWTVEVVADSNYAAAPRFAARREAECYAFDLAMRWGAVYEWRIVESDEPVNYRFVDDKLERVK